MTVLVLVAAAAGLRGHVARWLVEISPGVFVGQLNSRIRNELWKVVSGRVRRGQAILIYAVRNEQHWAVQIAGANRWQPQDFDGLTLFRRPRTTKED